MNAFDDADYFDCGDPEELIHESLEEALERFIDDAWEPGSVMGELLDKLCPLKVTGYARKKVAPRFGEAAIDTMLDDFDENYWCEEYGNPTDGDYPPWSASELISLKAALYKVMGAALLKARPWQCEEVGTREFSKAELMALIGDYLE